MRLIGRWIGACVAATCVFSAIAQEPNAAGAKALFCTDNGICSGGGSSANARQPPSPTRGPVVTPMGISYWIEQEFASGSVERVNPERYFSNGDRVRLQLRPNQGGYLYVFNLGTSGRTTSLYPRGEERARTEAGQTVSVPARGFMRFATPPGEELLLIVYSPVPIADYGTRQADIDNSTVQSIAQARGSKDLLRDEDFDAPGASKASYVVVPPSEPQRAINLSIRLKHR